MTGPDSAVRRPVARPTPVRITGRTIQIGLGLVWLLDGLLQLQPKMFGPAFVTGVLEPSLQGQPGFVAGPLAHLDHLVAADPVAFNVVFAAVQLLIGIGLLVRSTVKPALVLSVVWSISVWAVGEGFGMLFTGQASPLTGAPGAVILYAIVGILVWPRRHAADGGRSAAAAGPLGELGARIVWAALWVGMGALWLLPANRGADGLSQAIAGAASGEPTWLSHVQTNAAHAFAGGGATVALILALASCWIGIGPLVSRRPTLYLVIGAALSVDFWVLGQSLGGVLTGLGTDPNAGPLFVLLALALFPNAVPSPQPAGRRVPLPLSSSRAGGARPPVDAYADRRPPVLVPGGHESPGRSRRARPPFEALQPPALNTSGTRNPRYDGGH